MKTTDDMMAILFCRGWQIQSVEDRYKWIDPDGLSGCDYFSDLLDEYPKPVEEWIHNNITIGVPSNG